LVTIYAAEVREAVSGSIDVDKLAAAWVALHPSSVPQAAKALPELRAFLSRASAAIQDALRGVLARLWTEAWVLGNRSALAAVDHLADVDWGGWTPGDYAAAEQIAGPGLRQLLGEAGIRIKSIADSRLEELSLVLEETLRSDEIRRQPGMSPLPPFLSVGDLASRLKSVLDNPDRAELVAQAEIARAQATAARQVYAETGVTEVIVSTAEDSKVCPACDAAAALGPHPLGSPPLVPIHPRCRCAELSVLAGAS
jgi:post-segregation antitoxin (ccd killing protein)